MKWVNHKVLTGAIIYGVTGDVIMTSLAVLGSVIPDALEGSPGETWSRQYKRWRKEHRGSSHLALLYLLIFAGMYWYCAYSGFAKITWDNLGSLFALENARYVIGCFIVAFMALGACLHVVEDALCGKVPLVSLSAKKRIGVKLFEVGSVEEYFLVFSICIVLVGVRVVFL